jgi:hypothetical protein
MRPHVLALCCRLGQVERIRCFNKAWLDMTVQHFESRGWVVTLLEVLP